MCACGHACIHVSKSDLLEGVSKRLPNFRALGVYGNTNYAREASVFVQRDTLHVSRK